VVVGAGVIGGGVVMGVGMGVIGGGVVIGDGVGEGLGAGVGEGVGIGVTSSGREVVNIGGVKVVDMHVVVDVVVVWSTQRRHRSGINHNKHNDHQQLHPPVAAGTGNIATLPAPQPTYL